MKLWNKGTSLNKQIEAFTVGNDFLLDQALVPYDCKASIAHAEMLKGIGIITAEELGSLKQGLHEIEALSDEGTFVIQQEDEDCHTAIEHYLTEKCGEAGKKIHTARSRNDQVAAALRLYYKEELKNVKDATSGFVVALEQKKKAYGNIPMPGYTHMQKAMPSSVGLWLGAFASNMADNLKMLESVHELIDQNPLGSGAGFGIPAIAVDKELTKKLLGFAKVQENPLAVQNSRGKYEAAILSVLSLIMADLNKLATDLLLFTTSEFGFFSLPDGFTTGSSIMPQKKNYDALELVRGKYHIVLGYEFQVKSLIANLPSGYNRDFQLTKEPVMKGFEMVKDCLSVMTLTVENLIINQEQLNKAMTPELYATEKANALVKQGVPFREAYKEVAHNLTTTIFHQSIGDS